METENFKMPRILQHSIIDYFRVAIIAIIVFITLFLVKRFGNRTDDERHLISEQNEMASIIDQKS